MNIERIQIISIFVSLLFLAGIFKLIKSKKLKEAYSILWLFFGAVFLFFSCWKQGLDFFASLFGVYYPPALLFLILIVAVIVILVQFSVVISSQNDKIRRLTQELALLEANRKEKTEKAAETPSKE